jgi:hypothetical protein
VSRPDAIGPWVPDLPPDERLARYRSLRALIQIFCGSHHPLVMALARAESDPTDAAARAAWALLMEMPARPRRHVLASFATLLRNTPPAKDRKHG